MPDWNSILYKDVTELWSRDAPNWTFTPVGERGEPIEPDQFYLTVSLRSFYLDKVRRGWNTYYGVAHSRVSALHRMHRAEFIKVVTPGSSLELQDADRTVFKTINQSLAGPFPYRGGRLEISLALAAVKQSDFAGRFVSLLEEVSEAAGVTLVDQALKFAAPVKKGLELLTGTEEGVALQIGLDNADDAPRPGSYVVIRRDRDEIDTTLLTIDPQTGHSSTKGSP